MRHIELAYVNLHDFRYEGGAPINSGSQIPVVIDKKEYGPSQQARTSRLNWYRLTNECLVTLSVVMDELKDRQQ